MTEDNFNKGEDFETNITNLTINPVKDFPKISKTESCDDNEEISRYLKEQLKHFTFHNGQTENVTSINIQEDENVSVTNKV